MQQVFAVWNNLDMRRRVIAVLATIAMFAAVLGLSKLATKPSMALLYSGLESSAAGEVVQALEAQGAIYDVRGGAIFVESTMRDELRLKLASDGLPSNTSQGYELLDSLSGFGTTSQMFDAAYWRAKEGELARTIIAAPHIRAARVHIANASSQPFQRNLRSGASVTVTTTGGTLTPAQAKALQFLVASAVSGLEPADVSVIDGRGGLVVTNDEAMSGGTDSADRAAELKKNVERLLAARVGHGNAVVEVNVDTVTERESIVSRTFDPDSRVAISSETEELSNSSKDTRPSGVTVASNLPEGDGAAGGDSSSSNSEVRERVNYEVSETTRELQRIPGAIKRLSVAVLVDGVRTLDADGNEVWTPRSAEELASLRELVASAVGLDEERGDSLTLKTMEFEPLSAEGTEAQGSLFSTLALDTMALIQMSVLAIVALVLGLFVVRPIFSKPGQPAAVAELAPPPPPQADQLPELPAFPAPPPMPEFGGLPALNGEIDDGDFTPPQMAVVSDFDLGDDDFGISADPVKRLKKLIEDREEETIEILRSWMEDEGESV